RAGVHGVADLREHQPIRSLEARIGIAHVGLDCQIRLEHLPETAQHHPQQVRVGRTQGDALQIPSQLIEESLLLVQALVGFLFHSAPHRGEGRAVPNRRADRSFARSASVARSRGGACVTSDWMSRLATSVISSTARSNGSSLARDGLWKPLNLRTNWSEAA